jgi:hypothetical protein
LGGNVIIDALAKFLDSSVDIVLLPIALTAISWNLFAFDELNSISTSQALDRGNICFCFHGELL